MDNAEKLATKVDKKKKKKQKKNTTQYVLNTSILKETQIT
jgi:hypothetical protein